MSVSRSEARRTIPDRTQSSAYATNSTIGRTFGSASSAPPAGGSVGLVSVPARLKATRRRRPILSIMLRMLAAVLGVQGYP